LAACLAERYGAPLHVAEEVLAMDYRERESLSVPCELQKRGYSYQGSCKSCSPDNHWTI
jgi:hypothetical protein